MPSSLTKAVVVLLAMATATGLGSAMRPSKKLADAKPKVDLTQLIPESFDDWKIDTTTVPISVAPDVQERLDVIYNQTLSRTYINKAGQRIMLSIAYGENQATDTTQVHRPEFCYAAQGFRVEKGTDDSMQFREKQFPVRKIVAVNGNRTEPITYWITVGDHATLPGIGRKWAQLTYGLTGRVPDGLLFRISSLDQNVDNAFQLQDSFVQHLLNSVPPSSRARLIGQ